MFGEQFDSSPDLHLRLEFGTGRVCSPEVLYVVSRRMPAMPFSDVGRYRHRGFPDLVPKDRLLGARERLRRSIATHSKVHRFRPYEKISERFNLAHALLKRTRRAVFICLDKAMVVTAVYAGPDISIANEE